MIPVGRAWLDNIRTLVADSDHRFVDYTVLGEAAKEPEAIKTMQPSTPSAVNSRSVQATGVVPQLDRGQVEPMDLTTFYKTISAQGKLAIKQKSEQGEMMHQAPLGYRNTHVRGRTIMEPDPKTHSLVEDARRLRQQGCTIRTICRVMAEMGLRSKRGKMIGPSSMHKILRRFIAPIQTDIHPTADS